MKKIVLLALLTFSFCTFGFAQDFSFDELVKLRSYTYPSFETYVHDKGYKLAHLERNERCTVFRSGKNVVSYCHYYDDGYSYHNHVAIKFETSSKEEYEKIKQQIVASMEYYKTKLRRFSTHHYLEHIYVNDNISVHLYDISYRDDSKPYYEIEIYSVYAKY
jgi:hypothetical protein